MSEVSGDGDLEGGMIPVATANTAEVGAADTAASGVLIAGSIEETRAIVERERGIDSSYMNGRDRVASDRDCASDNDSRRNNSNVRRSKRNIGGRGGKSKCSSCSG